MTISFPNSSFWQGKRVLVTGHTGFKGGWLILWLHRLGAQVAGIGLQPNTDPNLFELVRIEALCDSHFCDIRNKDNLLKLSLSPGDIYGAYNEFYTRPDLMAIKNKNSWVVSLNDGFMSQELLDRIKEKVEESNNDYKHEAKSFLKGLERRQQTLLLVAEVIIDVQSDFLNGLAKKKALSNKEVADLLNISPSTVSRIVRNKYIQLPNELTNLKSLLAKRVNKKKQETNITNED